MWAVRGFVHSSPLTRRFGRLPQVRKDYPNPRHVTWPPVPRGPPGTTCVFRPIGLEHSCSLSFRPVAPVSFRPRVRTGRNLDQTPRTEEEEGESGRGGWFGEGLDFETVSSPEGPRDVLSTHPPESRPCARREGNPNPRNPQNLSREFWA